MKRTLAPFAPALLLMMGGALAGCGGGNGTANPAQLWLALDGDELHAKLVDHEPPPY